ncbi:MAG: thiamine pyrophosphate-requiring protein [Pseudomonadota bacterium]
MTEDDTGGSTVGELLLARLANHGIDYFFANSGTDFPTVIEAFAAAAQGGAVAPRPLLITHENVAVSMAHGAALVTGRPQAVMVHTSVGTANSLNALINASRERIPLVLLAGRSPVTQHGMPGSRSFLIHWAQEMYDQAGMLRELVKWDYELRYPQQIEDVVDRAIEVATAAPQGPVYLSLPREVLAEPEPQQSAALRVVQRAALYPPPESIAQLAEWVRNAKRPLIITSNLGRCPHAFAALDQLADGFGIGVVAPGQRYLALRTDHPLHLGYDATPHLSTADLVIVVESDVPWLPSAVAPAPGCGVVHIGEDPAFSAIPMRRFHSDLDITASAGAALELLVAALSDQGADTALRIASRREWWAGQAAVRRVALASERAAEQPPTVITPALVAVTLSNLIGDDALVFNEYSLPAQHLSRVNSGTYFYLPSCGGLGWGFGAALGAKLAAPDKLVVATLGDGAYVFNNPTSCHWVSDAHELPVLVLVLNNASYGAVALAASEMYGCGHSARDNWRMLSNLEPSPAYEILPQASGGYGERVSDPAALAGAIARGIRVVKEENRQALINIICR